jgi:hypothetical protein
MFVPEWKWDSIAMDFVSGLPKTKKGNDSIWVIVTSLTLIDKRILIKVKLLELSWKISEN